MSLIKFKGPNLIANGDFEAGDTPPSDWSLSNQNGAASSVSSTAGGPYEGAYSAEVNITAGGSAPPDIQFKGAAANISVASGMTYAVTLAAIAAGNRNMTVQVLKGVSPWTVYGLNQVIALTTGWQEFALDFTATATAGDGCLFLLLGNDVNNVNLDIVSVHRTLNFTRNPVYGGMGAPYGFRQPRDLSDGGVFYSYDKGVMEEFIELKWAMMPLADWTALDSFIRNEVVGAKNAFTYIDQNGAAHTVRIETDSVDFREARNQRYAGSLTLRKVG